MYNKYNWVTGEVITKDKLNHIEDGIGNSLDTDASNISNLGRSNLSNLGMPSSKYIDLTLGESGSTYTAPANGYFAVLGNADNVNGYFSLVNETVLLSADSKCTSGSYTVSTNIYCKKGDRVSAYYNYSPFSSTMSGTPYFRFIYAEGSKEE